MFITIQCDTGVIFNGNRIRCLIVLGNPVFNALDKKIYIFIGTVFKDRKKLITTVATDKT